MTVLRTSGPVVPGLVGPHLPARIPQSSLLHHCLQVALLQEA